MDTASGAGPLRRAVDFYFDRLADLGLQFWAVFDWPGAGAAGQSETLQLVTDVFFTMVAHLEWRLLEPLEAEWPYRGAPIFNVNAPPTLRRDRLNELHQIKREERWCCTDKEFTQKTAEEMGPLEDLTSPNSRVGVENTRSLAKVRLTNLLNEVRFGRTTSHMQAAKRGRVPKAYTLCCKHLLAELLAQWKVLAELEGERKHLLRGGTAAGHCIQWNRYLKQFCGIFGGRFDSFQTCGCFLKIVDMDMVIWQCNRHILLLNATTR